MGATQIEYARFKRNAADYARKAGDYPAALGSVFIVSQQITNSEGFTGDALVERGSTVTDFRGNTATFLYVSRGPQTGKSPKVVVSYDPNHLESYGETSREVYAEVFNLTVTEH